MGRSDRNHWKYRQYHWKMRVISLSLPVTFLSSKECHHPRCHFERSESDGSSGKHRPVSERTRLIRNSSPKNPMNRMSRTDWYAGRHRQHLLWRSPNSVIITKSRFISIVDVLRRPEAVLKRTWVRTPRRRRSGSSATSTFESRLSAENPAHSYNATKSKLS